jgi:hypothetical protein
MLFSSRLVTQKNGRRIADPSHRGIHGVNQRDHTTWDVTRLTLCFMEKYGEKNVF